MYVPKADEWWTLGTWTCIGQGEDLFDWGAQGGIVVPKSMKNILESFQLKSPADVYHLDPSVGQRIMRLIFQVAPWTVFRKSLGDKPQTRSDEYVPPKRPSKM